MVCVLEKIEEYLHSNTNQPTGTPWINIVMQMIIVAFLLTFDFNKIVIIDNTFSILSYLLEVASLIKLRIYRPNVKRAFDDHSTILSSTRGICLVMTCPVILAISILVSQCMSSDFVELIVINAVFVILGIVLERCFKRDGQKRVVVDEMATYEEIPVDGNDD